MEYGSAGNYVTAIRFSGFDDSTGLVTRRIGLKHGQKIAFTSVPVGTRFEAIEVFGTERKDWVPSAQVYENGGTAVVYNTESASNYSETKDAAENLSLIHI